MKLTLKLVSLLIVLILVGLAFDSWIALRREREFLEHELQNKAYRVGDALRHLIVNAWNTSGPDRAMALIEAANSRDRTIQIRWVWLDVVATDPQAPQADTRQLRQVLHEETLHLQMNDQGGGRMLYTYVAVDVDPARPGAIELSEPMQSIDDFTRASAQRHFLLGASILIGGGGITMLLGISLIGAPLQKLMDKAKRIGHGDLSEPIELKGRYELSALAGTINEMCENLSASREAVRQESEARLAAIEQLRHADRLQTVGQLASGVAHELGTPLNVVSGRAQLIGSGRLSEEEVKQSADVIRDQTDRMTKIIRQLLDFSRRSPSSKADVELVSLIRITIDVLQPLAGKHHVDLAFASDDQTYYAYVDAAQMQQVLTNLIVNAVQASPDSGQVHIDIRRQAAVRPDADDAPRTPHVCITVQDAGDGISEDDRQHLFEPFFTTKQIGDGTGLGLSIAYGIVQEHGGWIDVDSASGQGSCFRVFLPESTPAPKESATAEPDNTKPGDSKGQI